VIATFVYGIVVATVFAETTVVAAVTIVAIATLVADEVVALVIVCWAVIVLAVFAAVLAETAEFA